jgi:hypothetical protein
MDIVWKKIGKKKTYLNSQIEKEDGIGFKVPNVYAT